MNRQRHTDLIREEAFRLGFDFVGFAKAERLDDAARRLESWLKQGFHGQMGYMERYFDLRTDPTLLVPGAKTVICLSFNYHNPDQPESEDTPRISQYAYGQDYHHVIKDKLHALVAFIHDHIGEIDGRCFVDSAPVMEREWAARAGLGWNGKNTLTIHPKKGSWFFLAEIICDLPLVCDHPMKDYCGTCRRCIEACPTQAISPQGYLLDASKCISYLTIELKDDIPASFSGQIAPWMFGCDICQEVCPWNRFAQRHQESSFEPHPDLLKMTEREWTELTADVFAHIFKKSAVKRAKYAGLKRNISFLASK